MRRARRSISNVPVGAWLTIVAVVVLSFFLVNLIYPKKELPFVPLQPTGFLPSSGESGPTAAAGQVLPPSLPNGLSFVIKTPTAPADCTYTSIYWVDHPGAWRVENIVIGRLSYNQSEAIAELDGQAGDLSHRLLREFLTAVLNALNGADTHSIEQDLSAATDWLNSNLLTPQLSEAVEEQGERLLEALERFNHGLQGPGLCPGQPNTATPTLTPTASPTATRWTSIFRPATTATPTDEPGDKPPTQVPPSPAPTQPSLTAISSPSQLPPTRTPIPTRPTQTVVPTQSPPPLVTATPRPTNTPQPSNTSQPPNTPQPTNTPQPSNTPQPTKTPKPTNTPKPTKAPKPTHTP